ncbi:UNKNOWN [Stylonychia lemnae]|uniref:Uncharacterized protein n=1 Tax=Stylonychia lemnae TaxID=5949 RepID=A0A077ZRF1_STYLE|nr:UNKNOWN [Stylonychia lemnae]|eukprot:CDW71915.1 UNKNOWN [Stylonychia lemnae]
MKSKIPLIVASLSQDVYRKSQQLYKKYIENLESLLNGDDSDGEMTAKGACEIIRKIKGNKDMESKIERLQTQIRKVIYDFDILNDDLLQLNQEFPMNNILDDDSQDNLFQNFDMPPLRVDNFLKIPDKDIVQSQVHEKNGNNFEEVKSCDNIWKNYYQNIPQQNQQNLSMPSLLPSLLPANLDLAFKAQSAVEEIRQQNDLKGFPRINDDRENGQNRRLSSSNSTMYNNSVVNHNITGKRSYAQDNDHVEDQFEYDRNPERSYKKDRIKDKKHRTCPRLNKFRAKSNQVLTGDLLENFKMMKGTIILQFLILVGLTLQQEEEALIILKQFRKNSKCKLGKTTHKANSSLKPLYKSKLQHQGAPITNIIQTSGGNSVGNSEIIDFLYMQKGEQDIIYVLDKNNVYSLNPLTLATLSILTIPDFKQFTCFTSRFSKGDQPTIKLYIGDDYGQVNEFDTVSKQIKNTHRIFNGRQTRLINQIVYIQDENVPHYFVVSKKNNQKIAILNEYDRQDPIKKFKFINNIIKIGVNQCITNGIKSSQWYLMVMTEKHFQIVDYLYLTLSQENGFYKEAYYKGIKIGYDETVHLIAVNGSKRNVIVTGTKDKYVYTLDNPEQAKPQARRRK